MFMDKTEVYRVPEALALDMAYAEHPYRELAAIALRDNNEPFSRATIKAGERAATQVVLTSFGLYTASAEYQASVFDLAANVHVSKQSIVEFMRASGANERDAIHASGRLWKLLGLVDTTQFQENNENHSNRREDALPLQTLMHISRYYLRQSATNTDAAPSSILGMGWGAATVDLLNGFIARELQRIQNDQSRLE